jgi:nucleotide-binding universal stress UspA family protein
MKRKILVAVDGSDASMRAVEYVADVFAGCEKEVDITVYHVLEVPPMLLEHGGSPESAREMQEEAEEWRKRETERVEKEILAPALRVLKEKTGGGDKIRIDTKLADVAYPDVALVIIEHAQEGGYDTVVFGRRGRSRLNAFIFGSVTSKVIHHIQGRTIWVVE